MLIVGLGNPGKEYAATRHNAGAMVLAALARAANIEPPTPFEGRWFEKGGIGDKPVRFLFAGTYMNDSGPEIARTLAYYHLAPADLLLLHDEVDLPIGTARLARASGAAGHHGVESVIAALGTNEFARVRIGIAPTTGKPPATIVADFVLHTPPPEEEKLLADGLVEAVRLATDFVAIAPLII